VLALWLPSFGDAISQMVIEVLCEQQHTSRPDVSVGTVVSALALEYCSAPTVIMRNFLWRLVLKRAEERSEHCAEKETGKEKYKLPASHSRSHHAAP
jgi:hypothetical protein